MNNFIKKSKKFFEIIAGSFYLKVGRGSIIRIVAGFILVHSFASSTNPSYYQTLALIIGITLFVTVVHRACPFYRPLKINTCKDRPCETYPSKKQK